MNEQLKPCPFCGSTNLGHYEVSSADNHLVECYDCHASGRCYPTKDAAFLAWNTRALAQRPAAQEATSAHITWDAEGRRILNGRLAPEHATPEPVGEPAFWHFRNKEGPCHWQYPSRWPQTDAMLSEMDRAFPDRAPHENYPLYATRPAPGVPSLNKDQIRKVFLDHGFTVKEGQADLKPYVYDAAEALLKRASPASAVHEGLQWFTVAEHGMPDFDEEVIGGLWYTDPWLKPELATRFLWGLCRVFKDDHRDFKDGKRWYTFGPAHSDITHWARLNFPKKK